jgi:hypothetical protein
VPTPRPGATNGSTKTVKEERQPSSSGVSPLLFGTNLGLFDQHDQVLTSTTARTLLQKLNVRIVRMPLREKLPDEVEIRAAQMIKDLAMTPLIILHGDEVVSDALVVNTRIIQAMNRIFGNRLVYYEYGNEEDLLGIPKDRYTASWNRVVPQLKKAALNGHFIGPVNFEYDHEYLGYFLQRATPRPDEISWHEYTCDVKWATERCLTNINNWHRHFAEARSLMRTTLGTELPIMITEWNYAPNALPNDGKNNNSAFMTAWTTKALQALATNRVFASMQYSCTNTAIPMITMNNAVTTQGAVFQIQYQQMIAAAG